MLLQFAGSLLAVVFLVVVAWALRLGGQPHISDEDEARALADSAVCGFEAQAIALDRAGSGALLRDAAGRIMLLAPHGNKFVGRVLDRHASAAIDAGRLVVATGERLAPVSLDLPDPAAWCHAIEALD